MGSAGHLQNINMAQTQQVLEEIKLTEDGGVIKQILRRGTGETHPPAGASVQVHYVGTFADSGEQFDSSRKNDKPFDFKLGKSMQIFEILVSIYLQFH